MAEQKSLHEVPFSELKISGKVVSFCGRGGKIIKLDASDGNSIWIEWGGPDRTISHIYHNAPTSKPIVYIGLR
jgi:hypothetical protein